MHFIKSKLSKHRHYDYAIVACRTLGWRANSIEKTSVGIKIMHVNEKNMWIQFIVEKGLCLWMWLDSLFSQLRLFWIETIIVSKYFCA